MTFKDVVLIGLLTIVIVGFIVAFGPKDLCVLPEGTCGHVEEDNDDENDDDYATESDQESEDFTEDETSPEHSEDDEILTS